MSVVVNPSDLSQLLQRGSILAESTGNMIDRTTSGGSIGSWFWTASAKTITNFDVSVQNWTMSTLDNNAVQVVCNEAGTYQYSWVLYVRSPTSASATINMGIQTTQAGDLDVANLQLTSPVTIETSPWIYPTRLETFAIGDFIRPRFSSSINVTYLGRSVTFQYQKVAV